MKRSIGFVAVICIAIGAMFLLLPKGFSLEKYESILLFKTQWGSGPGQLGFKALGAYISYPKDFVVNNDGSIYVMDTVNNRINKYDGNGKFISNFKLSVPDAARPISYDELGSDGSDLYVFDWNNQQIVKTDAQGKLKTMVKDINGEAGVRMRVTSDGNIYVKGDKTSVKYVKKSGSKLFGVFGEAKDEYAPENSDFLYESPNGAVYKEMRENKKTSFKKIGNINKSGGANIQSIENQDLTSTYMPNKGDRLIGFDSGGNYYVSDYNYVGIKKYDPNGKLLISLTLPKNPGISDDNFRLVKVDSQGNVYNFLYDAKSAWIIKMKKVE